MNANDEAWDELCLLVLDSAADEMRRVPSQAKTIRIELAVILFMAVPSSPAELAIRTREVQEKVRQWTGLSSA